jgi:ABC-type branched-subunit amino acid transport system permease subunit
MTNLFVVEAASGHQIIVGVTRDLQFGHAVMFGMGGTLVDVLRDVSFRIRGTRPGSPPARGGVSPERDRARVLCRLFRGAPIFLKGASR